MSRHLIVVVTFVLACSALGLSQTFTQPTAAQDAEAWSAMLSAAGLNDLSADQASKVRRFVLAAVADARDAGRRDSVDIALPGREPDALIASATKFTEAKGFQEVRLSRDTLNHTTYLIVDGPYTAYCAKGSLTDPTPGRYYARISPLGGISSYLDRDGSERSLVLYTWKPC